MKKRIYMAPEMIAVELESEGLIAASGNVGENFENSGDSDMDEDKNSPVRGEAWPQQKSLWD